MSMGTKLLAAVVGASSAFIASMGSAAAGVLPPIAVPEPMTMALFGAGVGALFLVKKLRG